MTYPRARYDFDLSPLHTRALVALLCVGAVLVGVSARGRKWFGESLPVDDAGVAAAREFLDPNTASAASLQRLPGVGPTRAISIVQYRQTHGSRAFRTARDLEKVHGLGPGTVRKIAPYLTLPCGL